MFEAVLNLEDLYGANVEDAEREAIAMASFEEIGADDSGAQFEDWTPAAERDIDAEIDAFHAAFF